MTYLLDTDTCSFAMKRRFPELQSRFVQFEVGELKVSTASVYELHTGALKHGNSARLRQAMDDFLALVEILDFDRSAARSAASVRVGLESIGRPIGAMDTLIAGHALSIGATLITNNVREFQRVEGLAIENWAG